MARRTSLTAVNEISEINMTPLMDLTFILLITFIITFPLIEQGVPVNLPVGGGEDLNPDEAVSITVTAEGVLYLDDVEITSEALAEEMMHVGKVKPDIAVMVRGDEGILYAKVVEVMHILQKANITRMALVTQSGEAIKP